MGRRGIEGAPGIVAALLVVGAGCAHNALSPALHRSVHEGATVLVLTPLVTVTKGIAYEVDERASREASENVGHALQWYLENERGMKVVPFGEAPEEAGRVAELRARVDHILPRLRKHFAETGWITRGLPSRATIYSIEEDLAASGAEALVIVQGSDHVSDVIEIAERIIAGEGGGVSELELVILAPSGEVIYYDGLRQAGVWFLADVHDAFGFVAELASDLPKGR